MFSSTSGLAEVENYEKSGLAEVEEGNEGERRS